jgi:recombination protein RecA
MALTKKPKKAESQGSSSNPLLQAKSALSQALKSEDWQTKLDVSQLSQSLPHLPTGSMVIDYLIGGKPNKHGVSPCPGLPKGRIINLYGHESSGKSSLALTAAATTIKNGGTVCYIDWENEIVPEYAVALGVPVHDDTKFLLSQPETLEDGMAVAFTMASAGVSLIVFDSVGAGVSRAYFDKSIKETGDRAQVGANALLWSQFLPKLRSRTQKTGSTIIGISQMRDAINTMGYGDTSTVQGGKAWKFYSALRMKLQRIKTEKSSDYSSLSNSTEERVIGAVIKAKLDKCKVSPQQGNEETFYIRWGEGIDDLRSMMEIGIAHNLIKKSASWLEWNKPDGDSIRLQGVEKLRAMMMANPELISVLEAQVKPYMAGEGVLATSTSKEIFDDGDGDEDGDDNSLDAEVQALLNG